MWTDHGLTMAQSPCIWGRDCLLIGPLAWRCLAWQAEKLEVITCYNHDMAMAILIAHDLIYDSYMMVIWWLYHGQSVVIVRKNDYNKNHRLVIIQPYWLYLKKCLAEQRPNQHARNDQWMSLRVNLVYSRQGDCRPAVGDLKNGSSVCTKSLRVDVDATGFVGTRRNSGNDWSEQSKCLPTNLELKNTVGGKPNCSQTSSFTGGT